MTTTEKTHLDLYNEIRALDRASAVQHIVGDCNNLRGKTRARKLLIEFGVPGPDVIAMGENYTQVAESIMNYIADGKVPGAPGNTAAASPQSPTTPPVPAAAQPPAQIPHEERLRLIQHVRNLEEHFATHKKPDEWWHGASIDALNQYKAALEASANQPIETPSPGEPVSEIALAPTPQPPQQQQPAEPTIASAPQGVESTLPAIPSDWVQVTENVSTSRQLDTSPTGYNVPQNIIDTNPEGAIKLWYASFMNRAAINKAINTPQLRLICGRNGLKLEGCASKSKKAVLVEALLKHLWPQGHVEYYPEGMNNTTPVQEVIPTHTPAHVPAPVTPPAPTPVPKGTIVTDPLAPTKEAETQAPPPSPAPSPAALESAMDNVTGGDFLPMLQNVLIMQQEIWERQQLILNNLDILAANQATMDTVVAEMSRGIIRLNNLPNEAIDCTAVLAALYPPQA